MKASVSEEIKISETSLPYIFLQVALNFPHCHAEGVERHNLVVKAGLAGLVFGDNLRLEGAGTISRDLNEQGAKVALEHLLAAAITGIAGLVGDQLVLAVAVVIRHFGLQHPLHQGLRELLNRPS